MHTSSYEAFNFDYCSGVPTSQNSLVRIGNSDKYLHNSTQKF